MIIINLIII